MTTSRTPARKTSTARTSANRRPVAAPPTMRAPTTRSRQPAYIVQRLNDDAPALGPDQLPVLDEDDTDLASEREAAEAYGTSASDLRAELREAVSQRHSLRDDDDEAFEEDEAAYALARRMEQRNR